ncbi:hypothetical protein FSP39_000268 [Pinctada imbricata]|uniref:B box-type domain-containing protein n=1 Tax=Pinctada imbricata TaxID=66713 RepID=A0AA88XE86_PINIB|nr:hypothetical protein FSP39_000268 [Pinctada imbricata]
MAFSKSVNLEHAQTAVPCDACEDETPGEYYCIECKHTLCPPCEKLHRKFTKGHNVVLRTQVGDIDTTILTCTDHGDQASFHCEKCNVPVCGKCITGEHRGHEMSDLTELFDRKKKVLQNDITRMEESLCKFKKEREEIIAEKEKYDSKVRRTTTDMENEIKDAHKELDRIHIERMENLAIIRQNQLSICDGRIIEIKTKIDMLEDRVTEYKETTSKSSLLALLNLSRRTESIPEIGIKPKIPEPPVFVSGSLQKLGENLGKLQVSSTSVIAKPRRNPLKLTKPTIVSKFKCPSQGDPSICINKEGDVWLGGKKSRELVMVNIKGQVLKRRTIQNRPKALAVMDCGDVIISPNVDDSMAISRCLRDGTEQHIFYDETPSCLVSITADQKILICTVDGRVVRINGDGSNIKQIYRGSGDYSVVHAVENADGNIYISDQNKSAVVMITKDGKVLTTITQTVEGEILKWPLGLVVDKLGNTLCTDISKACVYIINQNGQMRKLIDSSVCNQEPRCLAVDNDNNLWIAHFDGTVLVVKYLS